MHVLLLTQYFTPENVGSGVWIHQLAQDLIAVGHRVTVLTAFPNYPTGKVFPTYQGKLYVHEEIDGADVVRSWIYSIKDKRFSQRLLQFGSFSVSSLLTGISLRKRPDVVYAILPPLTLGSAALTIGSFKRCPVVINVQDIFPRAAVVTGVLKNRFLIRRLEHLERKTYRDATHIVVISEGFKEDLIKKGVPAEKISIVPNWADPNFILPGVKDNDFRRELNANGKFVVLYSGGLGHNSEVFALLEAATVLREDPILFVIVGDGIHKPELQRVAAERNLNNVIFKPFQPLERYPEVLAACDISVVTLSSEAGSVSVPSKIFKQMAAARSVLAITPERTELERLINAAQCGFSVTPENWKGAADKLRWAAAHPAELESMGGRARSFLQDHHSRAGCTDQIHQILTEVVKK
jgi:colanic acid biosynthesis glycosyl transferase WcaI